VINSILEEISYELAVNLNVRPSLERGVAASLTSASINSFLIVGGSNARRLAEAIKEEGTHVTTVTCPGWRILRGAVEKMRELVEAEIQKHNPGCVIFQLMDNSVFFARAEDGSLVPARRGTEGVYHVDGDLVVAHKDTLCNLFRLLTPLFELVKGRKRVVVLPLPRYVTSLCCQDLEHIPNRKEAGFYNNIREGLNVLGRTFKDYLFVLGMRDTVLVDPAITIRGMAVKEIWGGGPHPPKDGGVRQDGQGHRGDLGGQRPKEDCGGRLWE